MTTREHILFLVAPAYVLTSACAASDTAPGRGALEIAVAPLSLDGDAPGVACYSVRVEHDGVQVFENPWVCSGAALDDHGREVPASGNGPLGDIIYVGACVDEDEGATPNQLTIALHTIYDATGAVRDDLILPPPLVLTVPCNENDDTRVAASFVLMLAAQRGFVDLVVRFDELECAAKIDCAKALVPLTDPSLDAIVVALTCSAHGSTFTELYVDTLTLTCAPDGGGPEVVVDVDPTRSPGVFMAAPATSFVQAVLGSEGVLGDGRESYWTLAVALADLSPYASCALTDLRMTAGVGGSLPGFGSYPLITLADPHGVRFWDGTTLSCKSPLDGVGSGLATTYADAATLDFAGCLEREDDPSSHARVVTVGCPP